jgi:hypothetical protein
MSSKSVSKGLKKNTTPIIAILLIVVLLVLAGVYLYINKAHVSTQTVQNISPTQTQTKTINNPTPSPAPTPSLFPLAQGPQKFNVSSKDNPDIYEVDFNTIDPKGSQQTVSVKVKDTGSNVTAVSADVKTDSKSNTYSLKLSSGTSADGVWTGSWYVTDSYDKNFVITFSSQDAKGNKSSIDLTLR